MYRYFILITLLMLPINSTPAHASQAEDIIAELFQELEAERHNYEFFGFKPGMTVGKIKKLATDKGATINDRYPSMTFSMDGLDIYLRYPAIVDRNNLDSHQFTEVQVTKTSPAGTMNLGALEKEYIGKLGKPADASRQHGSALLIFTKKAPQYYAVDQQCMEEYKTGHSAEEVKKAQYRVGKIRPKTGVDMVNKVEALLEYCPNTIPNYKKAVIYLMGPSLELQIEPPSGRLHAVMRYDAGSIILKYNMHKKAK